MRRSLLLLLFATPVLLHGQTSDQKPLAFEAASVKPNQSRTCDRDGSFAGGRFVMTCATLRDLIVFAHPRQDGRVRFDSEITGGPSWTNADRFDVIAKTPAGQGVGIDAGNSGAGAATPAILSAIGQTRQMAQALLADRFKLGTHHELRNLVVYELRTNQNDRTLGPRMRKVDVDCVSQRGRSDRHCGGFQTLAPGHFVGNGVTVSLLAQFLEMSVSQKVIDRTGLQGTFDVELEYTPDRVQPRGPNAPAVDPVGVSVFTALREQLGLKLNATKAPLDVLVIDHAEKPAPD